MSSLVTITTRPVVSVRETRDDFSDQLYRQLKEAIVDGRYRAGEMLPTIAYWVEELELSPKTVNAAVRALAKEGLVRSDRGAGTIVLGPTREAIADVGEMHLLPGLEKAMRLGLTRAEAKALVTRMVDSWFAGGDSRARAVLTSPLLPPAAPARRRRQ